MDNYTISSTNVNTQDEELTQANAFIAGWNAQFDPKPVKPMEHKSIPQQPAQPALVIPAAEPVSAPRPEASKPQPHGLPTSFLEQSELSQVTFFYDYGARLYTLHPDEVYEQAWINAGCAMRAAQRRFLGIGDYRDECTVKTFLANHLLLPTSKAKRKPYKPEPPAWAYLPNNPNTRIELTPKGFKEVPVEPVQKLLVPFTIPTLATPRYIDPATIDLWEQIELIALSEICCKMYSGGQSGSGDGLSLAPHRCGRCPACIAHKAEQIQWRLRRMAQAGPIYGKIVSEAEHDKLVRKYGKRSTFSAPLADGLRWTVVNTQFDGSQQLNSEFTAEVVRREVKDWLNKLVRNVPEGKRLANLDLAGDKVERIMVHRFSVTDQYKPQAERFYKEAEAETGLGKPTTREEAQARVKAAWPIFAAKAKAANLPLLNVREGWAYCDLISEGDTSYLRLNDETPAELLARLTAAGQMPPDNGNCPF